jgi:hypothetical protein
MSTHKFGRAARRTLVLAAGVLSLGATSALGFQGHHLLSQITQTTAGSSLAEPWGLTLDASGNLFVGAAGQGRVDVFDSANVFQGAIGSGALSNPYPRSIAVDRATGDVYVGDSGSDTVLVFKPSGGRAYTLLSTWHGANSAQGGFGGGYVSVAIDNSSSVSDPHAGDVYVLTTQPAIDVFKPKPPGPAEAQEGEWVGELSTAGFALPDGGVGAAVDAATGSLYVPDSGNGAVDEFSGEGTFVRAYKGSGESFAPVAVAVEESTHDVYAVDGANHVVDTFDGTGNQIGGIAQPLATPLGVAVNSSGGVYVSDAGSQPPAVDVFGPAVLLPDVTTGGASEVRRTSVKLEGVVDPDGQAVTSCEIEYGSSTGYGQSAPCAPAPGSGSSPVAVSAPLSGLAPGTTYHYRVVAGNANGLHEGFDATVATPDAVEGVHSEAATNVEKSAGTIVAMLNGSLEPNGLDAHYYFEYGETEGYGSVSPALPGTDTGKASKPEHAQTQLTGLKAGTTYHFRLVATNSFGATYGADTTFVTPGAVEGVLTGSTGPVQSTSATLTGSLEPNGFDTHYAFEYGLCATNGCGSSPYDKTTTSQDAGSASEAVPASANVSGLEPNASYHFRVVAESVFGTTTGGEERFTTAAAEPMIGVQRAPSITRVAATLGWVLNSENSETSYRVLYGTTSAYGEHTESGTRSGYGEEEVVIGLSDLAPETTYHYVLQATNQVGTVTGPDETLTTGPAAPPTAVTEGASEIVLTSATVFGTIDPEGLETSYEVDFGVDSTYGTSIYGEVGAGTEGVAISAALQNLAPGTTYHYRVVAINSDGRVYGSDQTFATPVYSNPIVLPSTLPLVAIPAIAFPTESPSAAVKQTTTKKKRSAKHKRKVHRARKRGKQKKQAKRHRK